MNQDRLIPGEMAPAFQAHDWQNNPIEPFGRHLGVTLLSFIRYASCPLCNLRVRELMKRKVLRINHIDRTEDGSVIKPVISEWRSSYIVLSRLRRLNLAIGNKS